MKDLKASLTKKLGQDKKKVLLLGLLALIIFSFIIFLTSLSGEEEQASPAQSASLEADSEASGTLSLNPEDKVPASQKYDYANLLNKPEEGTPLANGGTVTEGELALPSADAASAPAAPVPAPTQEPPEASAEEALSYSGETEAWLYCDSFDDEAKAQEQKALIAFQGVGSQVIRNQEGKFQLKVGPFASRDQGRSEFNRLGEAGLLGRCALVDEPKK